MRAASPSTEDRDPPVDPLALRHRRMRWWRGGLLVGGLVSCSAALVAWLFVPLGWHLAEGDAFEPFDYPAAWFSTALTVGGAVAVCAGVVLTMRARSFERAHPGLQPRTRVLDLFVPLLAAALAVGAQVEVAGRRTEAGSRLSSPASDRCPVPVSSDESALQFLAPTATTLLATIEVRTGTTDWLLAVDCRVGGQVAEPGDRLMVEVGSATWEEVGPGTPGNVSVRRYRLVGGRCCVYASLPAEASTAETDAALGSVWIGEVDDWVPLLTEAVDTDRAASLRHYLVTEVPSGLRQYAPGLAYSISLDRPGSCHTLTLDVAAAQEPSLQCPTGPPLEGLVLWEQVTTDEWLAFLTDAIDGS